MGLAGAAEPEPHLGPPTAAPVQPLTARAFQEQPSTGSTGCTEGYRAHSS